MSDRKGALVIVRRIAAALSGSLALVLLVAIATEAAHGTLLTIEAGHIGVGSVALLIVWLIAVAYVALLALTEERP